MRGIVRVWITKKCEQRGVENVRHFFRIKVVASAVFKLCDTTLCPLGGLLRGGFWNLVSSMCVEMWRVLECQDLLIILRFPLTANVAIGRHWSSRNEKEEEEEEKEVKREEKEEEEGDSGVRCCDRPCHSALTRTCTSLGSRGPQPSSTSK